MQSIACLPSPQTPGSQDRLDSRTKAWSRISSILTQNIESVDQAMLDLRTNTDDLISKLRQQCELHVEQLQGVKVALQTAVEEVESTLTADNPLIQTELGRFIRTAVLKDESHLVLFSYGIDVNPEPIRVLMDCGWKKPDSVPCVKGYKINLFHLQTQQMTTFKVNMNFQHGESFCFITPDSLLCVGGHPATASAYIFNTSTQALTEIQSMRTARTCGGIWKSCLHVYLFGGYNSTDRPIECSEKFSVLDPAGRHVLPPQQLLPLRIRRQNLPG